jgi:hypothetical protein
MQAHISLDNQDIVICFPKNAMSQETLAHFLDYFELATLNQNSQLQPQQADELAQEINKAV